VVYALWTRCNDGFKYLPEPGQRRIERPLHYILRRHTSRLLRVHAAQQQGEFGWSDMMASLSNTFQEPSSFSGGYVVPEPSIMRRSHERIVGRGKPHEDAYKEKDWVVANGIIGSSPVLRRVLEEAKIVASTDSTVLIQGETGTGKELIASAIHNLSSRSKNSFVRFNCAAVPAGLLESELFGHERGAFTGALTRKLGRFELADMGTLFLDEVGDMPLEIQAKLLRVLQEQEFERLGGTQTQRVNVRVIAATNCNLKQMMADKQFRSDLYFRLNVFPITIPPLRDRREDIADLVEAFVSRFSTRMNRRIEIIPVATLEALMRYDWPGNIRELQNFLERSVILSPGATLQAPVECLSYIVSNAIKPDGATTLEEVETTHIVKVLQQVNWVVGGPKGAAKKLGLKRTTLITKMHRLRIMRPELSTV
jgi:transcriptional regulator with GAF, ATPase, and Fis domain